MDPAGTRVVGVRSEYHHIVSGQHVNYYNGSHGKRC